SANCAIPNLLFDDKERFESSVPAFQVKHRSFSEFFMFLNSGGVIAKTFFIPLPSGLLSMVEWVDKVLTRSFPTIFALQRQIVLQKRY
ncbi:hypothetical protein, partial [Umezakia ovalisporum]|uniref:hypothetical protein n=1 Tax=Umezakia ovalisporum TaxID=75695 RepID=UPI0039C7377C